MWGWGSGSGLEGWAQGHKRTTIGVDINEELGALVIAVGKLKRRLVVK